MIKSQAEQEITSLIRRYPLLIELRSQLLEAVEVITRAARNGCKLLVCGNGGSAADSMHIVGELMKSFVLERKLTADQCQRIQAEFPNDAAYYIDNLQQAVPAISLVSEVALATAYSNDKCADLALAQQVLGYGKPGDVLLAISTSGNSANVVHAAKIARVQGVRVISLTGAGGGKLAAVSDVLLAVPVKETYQIQELHLPIYHALCLATEQELFGEE